MKRRLVSIHEMKRRLMRRMNTVGGYEAERVAVQIREHACALRFIAGASIAGLCQDTDAGAQWDENRMMAAIRSRSQVKR